MYSRWQMAEADGRWQQSVTEIYTAHRKKKRTAQKRTPPKKEPPPKKNRPYQRGLLIVVLHPYRTYFQIQLVVSHSLYNPMLVHAPTPLRLCGQTQDYLYCILLSFPVGVKISPPPKKTHFRLPLNYHRSGSHGRSEPNRSRGPKSRTSFRPRLMCNTSTHARV